MNIKKIDRTINIIYKFSASKNFDSRFFWYDPHTYYKDALKLIDQLGLPNTEQMKISLRDNPDITEHALRHAKYLNV